MTRARKKLYIRILSAFTATVMMAVTLHAAQDPIVFPAKGQSNEKMESDKYACYTWSKGQTGFLETLQHGGEGSPTSAEICPYDR